MERILIDIEKDTLAFVILVSLILGFLYSLIQLRRSNSATNFFKTDSIPLLIFSALGIPALIDLLKVGGFATFFSIIQLITLTFAIISGLLSLFSKNYREKSSRWTKQLFVLLLLGGLLTAGYLTYVEISAQPVICGVDYIGCDTVQNSSYALLLGFMPVALLGLLGYLAILIVWLSLRSPLKNRFPYFAYFQWGLALFGVVFSAYLTYLEVFVIHATCSWCITSAVIMNLLLWISTLDLNDYLLVKENEMDDLAEEIEE